MRTNAVVADTLRLSQEEKLLLSAIGTGPQSTSELARRSDLPRSTCLRALKSLHTRGLIGKTKTTLHRSGWVETRREKKKELLRAFAELLGEGDTLQRPIHIPKDEHEVVVYRGKEQLLELAHTAESFGTGERVLWLRGSRLWEEWRKQGFRERVLALMRGFTEKGVIFEEVLSERFLELDIRYGGPEMVENYKKRLLMLTVIPDEYLNGFYSDIMIFRDAVSLMNWHDEIAILIRNRDLVTFYKQIFAYIGDTGRRVNPRDIISKSPGS